MHEAYEVSHLLSLQLQIETIAAYENIVLIGTRQGQVLMYLCKSTDNGNGRVEMKLDLQRKQELSKKPIQQIDVIPKDKLLLCLSDNLLSMYLIGDTGFTFQQSFQDTKGASLFALDIKNTETMTGEKNCVVRVCVAVKRKLQLYFGKDGELKQHMYDFNINDVPKVMVWGTEYLWVGFKSDYTLFDLSSNKPKELFPVSSSSSRSAEPIIAKYSDMCFILGRDNTSVLVPEAKEIQTQQTIKWTEPTVALVWDEPYLIGLMQDKAAVQTVEPNHFIQTLSELNKARLMYKCNKGTIYVASIGQLWLIKSIDISKQRQELEKNKQFQLAIQLTELSDCPEEEKKEQIKKINKQYAYDLLNQGDYSAAMKEYIKLNIDPAEVISLFAELDVTNNAEANRRVGKDLEKALEALIEYLTALRAKVSKENKDSKAGDGSQRNVAQLLELIDTTLLKCYLQTNDALIAPLLRLNNCRLEEAERTLLQHGKHSELIILYQTKKQHTKALQLLREQAKQPDSSLHGYRSTKKYLQQLGSEHLHIIFNFSDWILKEHPEEGLQIFTEDKIEVENLPRIKILDFLLKQHEQLVIPYLEHVIHTWNETDSQFHDVLVNKYREKITDKKANITEEELQHTKSKLVQFLEQSCYYTPERMILYFPSDSLFEERAILLGRLGRHEQALAIYVQVLGNVEKAIKYCDNVTKQQSDKSQDVYVTLMRILVNPEQTSALTGPLANVPRHPKSSVPDLETALDILEKYADKISPLKALAVLPDSVPLMRLKTFLVSSLDNQLTLKRRMQVLKGLLYAEHIQVQELKQFHESKSVTINDYNVCPVCKKRFGNQSAFVRYPNGDIVHYSCRIDK